MSVALNTDRTPLLRGSLKRLPAEEQRRIGRLMIEARRRGDDEEYRLHRDRFVRILIPWIVKLVAKVYAPKTNAEIDDMVGSAILHVVDGLDKYDPDKGAVTTIMRAYIHKGVMVHLRNKHMQVRVPVHLWVLRNKTARGLVRVESLSPKMRECMAAADAAMASFATPSVSEEGQGDNVLSGRPSREPDPLVRCGSREEEETLRAALDSLPPREAESIRRHFGLDGEPETLRAIARTWGVSRERVRQYKDRGLSRLRETLKENIQECAS